MPQTQYVTARSCYFGNKTALKKIKKKNNTKKIPEKNTDGMTFSKPERIRYLVNICRHIVYPNSQDVKQEICHKNLQ